MRNKGVGSWAARRARMSPHRVAVVHDGREWTFEEVADRSLRTAHVLAARGVSAGDRVAYLGPNHPAFLETLFATGLLGAVFVPLNTRLAAPELDYILRDSGAAVLVHAPLPVVDDLRDAPTRLALDGLALPSAAEPLDVAVGADDVCMIMYTSGTTGRPKGAMLTHANIAWNSFNLLLDIDLTSTEVTLVNAPMFHVAALNMTVLPTFLKGGRSVLMSAFDPDLTLELIERHGVTYTFGVPAQYQMLARSPKWDGADLSSLRSVSCGGAPVPAALIETYQRRGLTFLQGYGLSEAAPGVTYLRADDSTRKVGSAGTSVFFGDVRVVRPDGSTVDTGEPGEILTEGPNVMAGYWGLPDATAEVLSDDGWLRTGDVAVLDDEGFAYIRDRVKDLIISGGENIYPAEVEDALYAHPAVAECAVVGVPDDRWGEVGRAFVVLADGASAEPRELLDFLDGRIARYKVPKSVVFLESLPRTGSGKVLKKRLR
jgi:fatty-acyl-CoA synthase